MRNSKLFSRFRASKCADSYLNINSNQRNCIEIHCHWDTGMMFVCKFLGARLVSKYLNQSIHISTQSKSFVHKILYFIFPPYHPATPHPPPVHPYSDSQFPHNLPPAFLLCPQHFRSELSLIMKIV